MRGELVFLNITNNLEADLPIVLEIRGTGSIFTTAKNQEGLKKNWD